MESVSSNRSHLTAIRRTANSNPSTIRVMPNQRTIPLGRQLQTRPITIKYTGPPTRPKIIRRAPGLYGYWVGKFIADRGFDLKLPLSYLSYAEPPAPWPSYPPNYTQSKSPPRVPRRPRSEPGSWVSLSFSYQLLAISYRLALLTASPPASGTSAAPISHRTSVPLAPHLLFS